MKKIKTTAQKLTLSRDSLKLLGGRDLSIDQLGKVAGGMVPRTDSACGQCPGG